MKPSHSSNEELVDQITILANELNLAVIHNASTINSRFDGYHRYLVGDLPAEGMTIRSKRTRGYEETRYSRSYKPSIKGEAICLKKILERLRIITKYKDNEP